MKLLFRGVLTISLLLAVAACSTEQAIVTTDNCASLIAPKGVVWENTPSWQTSETLPRYCRARGVIDERIQFELRMPEQWSGRFMMAGCGGFCGRLLADKPGYSNSINEALKRGYAAITHDGGHQAKSWETHWAYNDPEALEIWGHKVLPIVTETGVALTTSFYGKSPHHKYFSGCSNGGRLGMMAAQRYPDLFDGIAAGGSVFDLSGNAGLWGNWMKNQLVDKEKYIVPTAKVATIKQFVMQQCDGVDGQKDGIITDPRSCQVDFAQLQCASGQAGNECLNSREVNILRRLYGGVLDNNQTVVYPALNYGSEYYSDIWLFGSEKTPGWGVQASTGYRHLLTNDLLGKEVTAAVSTDEMLGWNKRSSVPAIVDAVDPDLSGLQQAGTKLFIYHGWADPLIIPEPMVSYFENAARQAGGLEQLEENARLFMVPGMGHCWERPAGAPDMFDPLLAVERWVESGEAPEYVVADQLNKDGSVQRSRPVCAYPKVAKLVEGNNPDVASSYQCSDARK